MEARARYRGWVATALVVLAGGAAPAQAARSPGHAHVQPTTRVEVVLTTPTLTRALTTRPDLGFGSEARTRGLPVISIQDTSAQQSMLGFGAAMTDTSAWLIGDELRSGTRARAMRWLFAPSGLGLDLVRVPIGGSDFTANGRPYTYDDRPPRTTDPTLAHFSIAHDYRYILPVLRQMMALAPETKVLATPWSPPAWMKTNDSLGDPGGDGELRARAYGPLARYFVRFIEAYRSAGVPVWAVTPQNEPQSSAMIPGLNLSPTAEVQFVIQNLRAALRSAGLRTLVFGGDRGAVLPYVQGLLQGAGSRAFNGIAWHCYGGTQVMSALHAERPSLTQIVSECSPGLIPYAVSEATISAVRNWASAVTLWNLALDPAGGPVEPPNTACPGCTGLLTISERSHTAVRNLAYYQLGQFSEFVHPGFVRIAATRFVHEFAGSSGYGVTPGLDDVAFKGDGTIVLVAYDNSPASVRFAVRWRGQAFAYTLGPGATVTFRWPEHTSSGGTRRRISRQL